MVKLCTTCCSSDPPKTVTPGSLLVSLALYCCFILPGLFYDAWRAAGRHKECRHCGGRTFAPRDAPIFKGRTC